MTAGTAHLPPSSGDALTELDSAAESLTCRQIRVSFGEIEALRGVDLRLSSGEWLGLIGPNGAGKSTLLRAIAGLVDYEGSVSLGCGRRLGGQDVALVPQNPTLPEGMTVAEYALLGRSPHLGWLEVESRRDRRIVATALERLNLQRFADRPVTHLSGGEIQRVTLARALVQQAPILLLDEPTSSLDLGHRDSVLELIDKLRRNVGVSVIAAMHDLSTAARFADRLALIHRGRIVADGPPQSVLQPSRLSAVYATPLNVHTIDGEIVVLPTARTDPNQQEHPTMTTDQAPLTERPYERGELRSAPSLVLVNTGEGKGKSTAAFGTVLRAVALGWPTAVVQFLKSGDWNTGEEKVCRSLGVEWSSAGDGFTWESEDLDETQAKAVAAWQFSAELIAAGNHRLVVLDEISYAMTWGWIAAAEVAAALAGRPEQVNVILTGRDMAAEIVEVADTVSEMVSVKHAFDRGIRAKKGIDY